MKKLIFNIFYLGGYVYGSTYYSIFSNPRSQGRRSSRSNSGSFGAHTSSTKRLVPGGSSL